MKWQQREYSPQQMQQMQQEALERVHCHLLLHDFDFLLYQVHHPGAGGIGQQPV